MLIRVWGLNLEAQSLGWRLGLARPLHKEYCGLRREAPVCMPEGRQRLPGSGEEYPDTQMLAVF